MAKFITHIEELPQERQEALIKGLQSQIIAQAVFVREEQPAKFLSYVDNEIGKADSSMLKMVEESGREGAELYNISEIYIWNKERKKALERLKKEYLDSQKPEPQRGELHYYCQKAIEKGYLVKAKDGYRKTGKWTKAQLAYFLRSFPLENGRFPDKEYSKMFGESRLGKALSQLMDNKNGDGKPMGFESVDEILLM